MGNKINDPIVRLMGLRYKSHPWHGLDIGTDAPNVVTAFIEMVPTDTVKYELDKVSGYIKIDRPQKYSNVVPALYGFLPQTYCGDLVAEYCMSQTERTDIHGDGDPLDICVLTEKTISHGDIIAEVRPIGGFRMLDKNEADDKIIDNQHFRLHPSGSSPDGTEALFEKILYIVVDYYDGQFHKIYDL